MRYIEPQRAKRIPNAWKVRMRDPKQGHGSYGCHTHSYQRTVRADQRRRFVGPTLSRVVDGSLIRTLRVFTIDRRASIGRSSALREQQEKHCEKSDQRNVDLSGV